MINHIDLENKDIVREASWLCKLFQLENLSIEEKRSILKKTMTQFFEEKKKEVLNRG